MTRWSHDPSGNLLHIPKYFFKEYEYSERVLHNR